MKKKKKHLCVDEETHLVAKQGALLKKQTIEKWVTDAILLKIIHDKEENK